MTDFGVVDDSVTICKGVMLSIDPALRIIDITHQVTPYSILDGARFLAGTTPYFPAGTVFVVVIDPGVGSTRKAMVVKSKRGQFFVLPDNGLITLVQDQDGIESAHEITNTSLMIGSKLSSTFHGRDIFSPVAAHLASGEDWTTVGPEMTTWVRLDIKPATLTANGISGEVIALDGPYGNIITNINADDFSKLEIERGTKIPIKLGPTTRIIPYVKTFSDVAVGQPLLYVDSRGHMALAINQGNFANAYHIKPPIPIEILKPTKSH